MRLPVDSVVFRTDVYPRIKHDWDAVDRYIDSIDQLPPIEVNQRNELIDGWHRWTAHKKSGATDIEVTVTETASDMELLHLAIERNRAHGLQLSRDDKEKFAVQLYVMEPNNQGSERHAELAALFSVGVSTVRRWLKDIDAKRRDEEKALARKLWQACYTQEEIAEAVGQAQQTVAGWIQTFTDFAQLSNSGKTIANFAEPDWSPPLYNVWTAAKLKDEGQPRHFGNSTPEFVDRLVYLYTKPLDIVFDPFAGSGSTIDVCRKRFRRYWVSDRLPIERRADEIRRWDIGDGLPSGLRWSEVKLAYLDPPYWKQAENKYSKDAEDMANMPLEQFTDMLVKLVKSLASKMSDAYIALIISPTQWPALDRQYTDHAIDVIKALKLTIHTRIQAPYSTEQYNGTQVDIAKQEKMLLTLNRELVVWRV